MFRIVLLSVLVVCAGTNCESKRVELASRGASAPGDFGRSVVMEAVARVSKTPTSEEAYAEFAKTVETERVRFNRAMTRDAELHLSVHAVGPLHANLERPVNDQMQRLATTVWPTVLGFPSRYEESAEEYVQRLCEQKLSIGCRDLVPEYWPHLVSAHVWSHLKGRVEIAYDRCHFCKSDQNFAGILANLETGRRHAEQSSQKAKTFGVVSLWPRAGSSADEFTAATVVSFRNDGEVAVGGTVVLASHWRNVVAKRQREGDVIGVHLPPRRIVQELLNIFADLDDAGYTNAALIAREATFPYAKRQYLMSVRRKSYRDLGVTGKDTVQVLVQTLNHENAKQSAGGAG